MPFYSNAIKIQTVQLLSGTIAPTPDCNCPLLVLVLDTTLYVMVDILIHKYKRNEYTVQIMEI